MPGSPGGEFVPLEPIPLTPRTPREDRGVLPAQRHQVRAGTVLVAYGCGVDNATPDVSIRRPIPSLQATLSPHRENEADDAAAAALSTPARLTPGPVREWVFRDDEISTDTRSSTTEFQESSQEEEGEGGRPFLPHSAKALHAAPTELRTGRPAPYSDKGMHMRQSMLCIA